jgi:hypothetical protein
MTQKEKIERLEEKLNRIKNWCIGGYPDKIYSEPSQKDWEEISKLLSENNYSLGDISISNMRHVLKGVLRIIEEVKDEL